MASCGVGSLIHVDELVRGLAVLARLREPNSPVWGLEVLAGLRGARLLPRLRGVGGSGGREEDLDLVPGGGGKRVWISY